MEKTGLDILQQWISRDPSFRVVDRMARINGRCLVELRAKTNVFTSTSQLDFDSAVRAVVMTAMHSGEP